MSGRAESWSPNTSSSTSPMASQGSGSRLNRPPLRQSIETKSTRKPGRTYQRNCRDGPGVQIGMSTYGDFNRSLVADFRANHGKATSGPFVGRDILILTTKGARSKEERTTPLVYTRDGDRYVIVASKGGAPT